MTASAAKILRERLRLADTHLPQMALIECNVIGCIHNLTGGGCSGIVPMWRDLANEFKKEVDEERENYEAIIEKLNQKLIKFESQINNLTIEVGKLREENEKLNAKI